MTIKLFPLNNTDYTADDMATYFSTRTNGVFSANGELATTSNNNMTVTVSTGRAWLNVSKFKGLMFCLKENKVLTVEQADGILNRIDRVVVRYDIINNNGVILIKKGTPSSTPVAPALVRNETEYYELAIADILVSKGVTSITASAITDQRLNTNLCGVMADGVTHIPTDVLENQFKEWFENLQNQLDSNQATNLQNQINEIKPKADDWESFKNNGGNFGKEIGINSYGDLIKFNTERPWRISQVGSGVTTALALKCDSIDKSFRITNSGNNYGVSCYIGPNGDGTHFSPLNDGSESLGATGYRWRRVLALTGGFSSGVYTNWIQGESGAVNIQGNAGIIFHNSSQPNGDAWANFGNSTNRWKAIYASTGTIQTSDMRMKTDIRDIDDTIFYDLIKNTGVHSYVLNYPNMPNDVTQETAPQEQVHVGIIAQEMAEYAGSEFILVQDEGGYSVNNYNLTSAVMGALKVEISKREQLENEVNELKTLVNQLLNK